MNCPKCEATELTAVHMPIDDRSVAGPKPTIATLEYEQCPECSGIWFDPDEMRKYLGAKVKLNVPKATPRSNDELDARTGHCPKCKTALAKQAAPYNPNVKLDACGKCGGMWVDAAELAHA